MFTYLYPDAGAGEGARLVRGDTHEQSDLDAAGGKKERQMETKRQGEEVVKMEFEDARTEACVKRCTHCPRIFARPQAYAQHVAECKEKQAQKDFQKTTAVLRSAVEIARDVVHSAAGLSIGADFAYKGQVDKTLFFPKPFVLFPESVGWLPEPEGWASKGATVLKPKHVRFTTEQSDFLKKNSMTAPMDKILEHDARQQMKDLFKDKDPNNLFSLRLVVTTTQIISSFSCQNQTRKKLAAKRVIDQALLDAYVHMYV